MLLADMFLAGTISAGTISAVSISAVTISADTILADTIHPLLACLLALFIGCPSRPNGSYAAYNYKYRCSHFSLPEDKPFLHRIASYHQQVVFSIH